MHDDTVDRTTDGSGRVADYDFAMLRQLDAGSWFDFRFAGERVPSLAEVLEQVAAKAHINIEIKAHQSTDPILAGQVEQKVIALVATKRVRERVLVSSFDPQVLKRVKQLDPDMNVAFISKKSPLSETRALCLELDLFSYHPRLSSIGRNLVTSLHKDGVRVFPWNIENAEDIRYAFSLGVDGLIAKDPLLVRQCYHNDLH
jgi:glycerophosphoryl diester phosphodiesterase